MLCAVKKKNEWMLWKVRRNLKEGKGLNFFFYTKHTYNWLFNFSNLTTKNFPIIPIDQTASLPYSFSILESRSHVSIATNSKQRFIFHPTLRQKSNCIRNKVYIGISWPTYCQSCAIEPLSRDYIWILSFRKKKIYPIHFIKKIFDHTFIIFFCINFDVRLIYPVSSIY